MFASVSPSLKPKRTAGRFDAKSANATKQALERERMAALTSPTPTRGHYFQVTAEGPRTVEAIAEMAGIAASLIVLSSYNHSRYYDPVNDTLALGPSGPHFEYPLLWIPDKTGAPVEDQSIEFDCPLDRIFHVQKIGTAGGRSPDMKTLDSEIVIEGTRTSASVSPFGNRIRVDNPNVLAQAIVDIPAHDPQKSSSWKIGLSRTIYEDTETWEYDRNTISDRMTSMTGGPVLDVEARTGSMFDESFRDNPIPVDKYAEKRALLEISDRPTSAIRCLINPHESDSEEQDDRLRRFRRFADFSAFLLAYDEANQQICPLAYASYHQSTDMNVSWSDDDKPRFQFGQAGRPELTHYGSGAGHRLPEFSRRADKLANDFGPHVDPSWCGPVEIDG